MDVDSLEGAINSAKNSDYSEEKSDTSEVSKDEEIGFHKGALNTLISERNELIKMVDNVSKIASAHMSRLKELGVDLK